MNSNTPNNINSAVKQALRRERAENILKEGYTFHKDADTEIISVCKPGKLAAAYTINLMTPGCSCPDRLVNGNYCKHEMAWDMLQEEEAMWENICAEHEARIEADDVPYFYAER